MPAAGSTANGRMWRRARALPSRMLHRLRSRQAVRLSLQCDNLDAFCQETGLAPDGMKIDVDGAEVEILEGAAQTLRSPQLRPLLMETFGGQPVRDACERLLLAAGMRWEWRGSEHGSNEIWVRA